jgi:hypothetical protein
MNFPEKYQIVREVNPAKEALQMELNQYDFDGSVDFMEGPTGVMNLDGNVIVPMRHKGDPPENETYMHINNKLVKLDGDHKFIQVGTVKFSKSFHFQDFLDKNKDANALIFYPCPDYPSVFHPGNHIRVAVINNNNDLITPKEI